MITHRKLSPGSHISRLVNQGIEKLPPSKICGPKTRLKMFHHGASAPYPLPPAPPPLLLNPALIMDFSQQIVNEILNTIKGGSLPKIWKNSQLCL